MAKAMGSAVGRRIGTPKTGGKVIGSKNKVKPVILPPTDENRQLALMAPTLAKQIRTPKAVMLDAMIRFDDLSKELMAKAKRMTQSGKPLKDIMDVMAEGHRFTIAAVQCAEKVAPYVHARLLAIESRSDLTDDRVPFVLRAPSVMENSSEWQAVASQQAVALDKADRAAVQEHLRELDATREPPTVETAPGARLEGLPHPAIPRDVPKTAETVPATLVADPKTGRVTVMPPGPRLVQPTGTEEWLEAVARDRVAKRAVNE